MNNLVRNCLAVIVGLVASSVFAVEISDVQFRRPVALALSPDDQWLYVANRDIGSVSIIDVAARTLAGEFDVGGRLSDIAMSDDGHLMVLDRSGSRLLLLAGFGTEWTVVSTQDVATDPVQMIFDAESRRCYVASLWSRKVTTVELSPGDFGAVPQLKHINDVELPFEPGSMALLPDGNPVVAGRFNAVFAVLDASTLAIRSHRKVPGHNIGGLAISSDGKRLLATQQELNPLAHSSENDIHWGNMISNLLVSWPMDDICNPDNDLLRRRRVHYLGGPGRAAGDPGPLSVRSDGTVAVVLSGTDEVAIIDDTDSGSLRRIPVGRNPIALQQTADGTMFVANRFSDSISVVSSDSESVQHISLGDSPEPTAEQLGEMLFHDSHLSLSGWMSCHSCHTDGHSNGQLNDNFSDQSYDTPKQVLSLLGVAETKPWAWNGGVESLEQQVRNSIVMTMHGSDPTDEHVDGLVAFLKTLQAPTAAGDLSSESSQEIAKGRQVFESLNCQRCHVPPTWTSPGSYDVGLQDEVGNKLFNPPSLLGVSRRTRLLHDGRATSLSGVVNGHRHQLPQQVSHEELVALVKFLLSL